MRMIDADVLGLTDFEIAMCNGSFEDGLKMILSKIQNAPTIEPEQRWIPCGERLPEEYTRVIGYMAWHAMTVIEYQHGRWYSIDHLEPLPDEAVSHWMPLPKPPKEGTK